MTMLENGMLIGAEAEWERLNAPTAWEDHDDKDVLNYMNDRCCEGKALAWYMGLKASPTLDEDAAYMIWDELPEKLQVEIGERYIESEKWEDYERFATGE